MPALDPEVAAAQRDLPPDPPPFARGDWAGRRRHYDALTRELNARRPPVAGVTVEALPEPRLRVYRSEGETTGGVVVFLRGGGHFVGDIDACDPACRRYAATSGVTLVSVDYRSAPEHPYPAAHEDAYAALAWAAAHLAEPGRLAIMGESAGGGLAAGVALMARDRGGPALARQILIYPMLDDRTAAPDPALAPFLTWTHDDNATGWACLLGGTDAAPAYAAPARAGDLTGLPAAYVEVGRLDLFCDEDIAYAQRLSRAGVEVELVVRPGVPHDFEAIAPDADVTRRAAADRARVLRSV